MVILAWHSRHQVYTLAIQSSVTVDQDIKRLRAPPLSLQYLIKLLYILTTRTAIHYLSHTRPRRKTYHRERTQQPISKESTSNPSTSRHLNTTTHRASDTSFHQSVTDGNQRHSHSRGCFRPFIHSFIHSVTHYHIDFL